MVVKSILKEFSRFSGIYSGSALLETFVPFFTSLTKSQDEERKHKCDGWDCDCKASPLLKAVLPA